MSLNSGWIESVTSELRAPVGELNFQQTYYDVSTFSPLFLIRFFLYLQVTRTCIKSRTRLTFAQIGPLSMELAALERLKISHRLIMGKWCLQASSFIFIGSSSNLLVTRTAIKSRVRFSGWIESVTSELRAHKGPIKFSIDILWNLQVQLTLQTLEFFVTLFSGTVRPIRLKLGTHVSSGQIYHVYWN